MQKGCFWYADDLWRLYSKGEVVVLAIYLYSLKLYVIICVGMSCSYSTELLHSSMLLFFQEFLFTLYALVAFFNDSFKLLVCYCNRIKQNYNSRLVWFWIWCLKTSLATVYSITSLTVLCYQSNPVTSTFARSRHIKAQAEEEETGHCYQ